LLSRYDANLSRYDSRRGSGLCRALDGRGGGVAAREGVEEGEALEELAAEAKDLAVREMGEGAVATPGLCSRAAGVTASAARISTLFGGFLRCECGRALPCRWLGVVDASFSGAVGGAMVASSVR